MKDRNKLCKFYQRAGVCSKNKGCTIWGDMQHCGLYEPDLASKPLRTDKRKRKCRRRTHATNGTLGILK